MNSGNDHGLRVHLGLDPQHRTEMAPAQRDQTHLERGRVVAGTGGLVSHDGAAMPVRSGGWGRCGQPMRTSAPRRYSGVISSSGTDGRVAASSVRTVGARVVVGRSGQLHMRQRAEDVGVAAGPFADGEHGIAHSAQLLDQGLGSADARLGHRGHAVPEPGWYSDQNTSPRLASTTAAISRSWRRWG